MTQSTSTIRVRAYRDLRAPLGTNRAYDLVGRVALSTNPAID